MAPHAERRQNLFIDETNAICNLRIRKAALRVVERLVNFYY